MAVYKTKAEFGALGAPWGKTLEMREIEYDGGLTMLQVRIREGRRITILDLDTGAATRLGDALAAWAASQSAERR